MGETFQESPKLRNLMYLPALWRRIVDLEETDDPNCRCPSLPQALLRYIPFVDQCEAGFFGDLEFLRKPTQLSGSLRGASMAVA